MKKLLYNAINKLGYNIYKKNRKDIAIIKKLEKYNVSVHFNLLFRCSSYVFVLAEVFEDLEISDAEEFIKISFNNMVFYVESGEEFIILNEIFIDNDYDFGINEECVLIDIGANVGMATIFFSKMDNIKKIYAFEPVKDNFDLAQRNFDANQISNVDFYNFGLGKEERDEKFLYSRQLKGNSGLRGTNNPYYQNLINVEEKTVKIKRASEILSPILEKSKEFKIVVKMDCEGAEYEIIENLSNENLLSKINIIMLEWHDYGPERVEKVLKESGFLIFSRPLGPISGMIYGVRAL